ncbi:MAG: 1-acylglycerol-3-phosphate O-acyltransferase [Chitinivibrionales bacterium]|nr:1-acylglycerol-3-phosphate O-acyltransferase [Chitinivibrionales bacterium]
MAQQDGGVGGDSLYRPSYWRTVLFTPAVIAETLTLATVTLFMRCISRGAAFGVGRVWSWIWLWMFGARVTVHGLDRLERGKRYVFVSNHQSACDIPLLYGSLPFRISFISKKELMQIPIFGWGTAAAGHIAIDRSNARKARKTIAAALEKLRRGNASLVIFPEGTRSADGTVGEFKTGSFRLAIDAGVEVVPLAIQGTRRVQPKGSWVVHPGPVSLSIGEPIPVEGLLRNDKAGLAQMVRSRVLELMIDDR